MKNLSLTSKRGSAIIGAIIIAMLIGGWMAATFQSSYTEYKLSKRYMVLQSAMNLAESGLEEGVRAYNNSDWTGWTMYGTGHYKEFSPGQIGTGLTGTIKVFVIAGSTSIEVAAEGSITDRDGAPITKQVRVDLSKSSYWANGLLARREVILNGNNIVVDSYDSRNGDYGLGTRNSKGNIGSLSLVNNDIHTNNADIYGYITTGGSTFDLSSWFHNNGTLGEWGVSTGSQDASRVVTDFYVDLPPISVPNYAGFSELNDINSAVTLGSPLSSTVQEYQAERINLSGNGDILTIDGPVRMYVRRNVSISGKGGINITATGSLELYVMESISISGNGNLGQTSYGLQNATRKPEKCFIYNVTPYEGGTSVDVSGNGQAYAVIYAPNSNIHLQGGGNSGKVCGAIVGYQITLGGGYEFHYDEALADLGDGSGFKINFWRELKTPAERLPFDAPLNLPSYF